MAKKKVVVLVRHSPLNTVRNSEALRMSVGLTLADNEVTALLLDAAAWLAVPLSPQAIAAPEIKKHLDTLRLLNMRVKVEGESLERYGVPLGEVLEGIEVIPRRQVIDEITAAEAVICF